MGQEQRKTEGFVIHISTNAAKRIQDLVASEKDPATAILRVSVKGGGCSGMSYKLSFDNQTKDDDKIFEELGVKLAVDKKSYLFLVGMTLDFDGGLNGKGFTFSNPNAQKTCGCGASFSV
jgi:iron-sulfur cluster assembly protein